MSVLEIIAFLSHLREALDFLRTEISAERSTLSCAAAHWAHSRTRRFAKWYRFKGTVQACRDGVRTQALGVWIPRIHGNAGGA